MGHLHGLIPAALVGVSLLMSLLLMGCEEPYETALRRSCHWNLDIQIKGCSRWGFKNCIDNCEFCVGEAGTPLAGQSDECAQLKCAAYCAKQESEKCQTTYSHLCEGGSRLLAQSGQACDVDCNAAAPRSPRVLGLPVWLFSGLLLVAHLLSEVSRRGLCAFALGAAALHLQGCSDCEPGTPSLGFVADFEEMDRFAGCRYEWDFTWGNPCASDLPVLGAKKGYIEQADADYMRGAVENEAYHCTQRGQGGYCAEWTAAESGCDEEDFGICTCKEASPGGSYCRRWQCISKEADQHRCWKDCCGDSCDPCVQCDVHGSSPFPMNENVFRNLLASDGTAASILPNMGANGNDDEMFKSLRRSHWHQFSYYGECIMPRDVHNVHETTCESWREIETEIAFCECLEEHSSGRFCQRWRCEEKDVGMFSILFAGAQSYAAHLDGMEEEFYTCLQSASNGDQQRCVRWKGDIASYEEVEMTVCATKCQGTEEHWCDHWACNEYELPRVHDEDQWGKRLGFLILHCFWILGAQAVLAVLFVEGARAEPCAVVIEALGCFLLMLLIWAIGFVRINSDEGRWRSPAMPLLFLLLTLWAPHAIGATVVCLRGGQASEAMQAMPMMLAWVTFLTCGTMWTTGVVGFLIIPFPLITGCLCCTVGAWRKQS